MRHASDFGEGRSTLCPVWRRVRLVLSLVLLSRVPVRAQSEPTAAAAQPVDYAIVVTGSELLAGVYADSHTFFITRTLTPLGLHCVGSISVDDREADMRQALDYATARPLGDRHRRTRPDGQRPDARRACGLHRPDSGRTSGSAASDGAAVRYVRDALRANLRRQTRVPTEGSYLQNSSGTAVGLVFPTSAT